MGSCWGISRRNAGSRCWCALLTTGYRLMREELTSSYCSAVDALLCPHSRHLSPSCWSISCWCLMLSPRKLAKESCLPKTPRAYKNLLLGQLWRAIPGPECPVGSIDTFVVTTSQLNSSFCLILLPLLLHWYCPQEPYPVSPLRANLHFRGYFTRASTCISLTQPRGLVECPSSLGSLPHSVSSWQNSGWDFDTPHFAKFLIHSVHQSLSPGTTEDCVEEDRGDPSLNTLFLHCMREHV